MPVSFSTLRLSLVFPNPLAFNISLFKMPRAFASSCNSMPIHTRSAGKDIAVASHEMSTTPIAQQEAKDSGHDGSGSYDPSPCQPPRSRRKWTKEEVEEIQERHSRGESWRAISTVREHLPHCNEYASTKSYSALQGNRESRLRAVVPGYMPRARQRIAADYAFAGHERQHCSGMIEGKLIIGFWL